MGDSAQTFKEFVELNAERKIPADDDDFSVYDWSGGNYDDAYQLGWEAGYAAFARDIMDVHPEAIGKAKSS